MGVREAFKVSNIEFHINLLYCESLPGYTWQCGKTSCMLNHKLFKLKDMILLLEKFIRGVRNSVLGDRYVKTDDNG